MGDKTREIKGWAAGSSLMGDALDWGKICPELDQTLQTWFVAGSSPYEWEPYQEEANSAEFSLICISIYDLNELFLCDFRSEIVPIWDCIRDLKIDNPNWNTAKKALAQYPMKNIRLLYPTAGRSSGVLGGLKEEALDFLKASERPTVGQDSDTNLASTEKLEKISNWELGYKLRRQTKLYNACNGQHDFNGPKHRALLRILKTAHAQGKVIVVVLPVSPAYEEYLVDANTRSKYDKMLERSKDSIPNAIWLRLDIIPELKSNELYWDLVHLNSVGKSIATDTLLDLFRTHGISK